jgi:drug/metabolite transporter (DMT)-like permease
VSRLTVRLLPIDALLLLMTVIWGSNFTIVKVAVHDIPEFPFNALRLAIAAVAFAVVLAGREGRPRFTPAEWRRVLVLSLVGHAFYQWLFITGLARTRTALSSLRSRQSRSRWRPPPSDTSVFR